MLLPVLQSIAGIAGKHCCWDTNTGKTECIPPSSARWRQIWIWKGVMVQEGGVSNEELILVFHFMRLTRLNKLKYHLRSLNICKYLFIDKTARIVFNAVYKYIIDVARGFFQSFALVKFYLWFFNPGPNVICISNKQKIQTSYIE